MVRSSEHARYLKLLSEKYPSKEAILREVINLNAILNLPKGTEHFMSDLHGEYEAFYHILNNCSGVIREKIDLIYQKSLSITERQEIATLIYYPHEKLELLKKAGILSDAWYRLTLQQLVEVAKLLSSKYTRSKVRKAMPKEFAYILDELIHVQIHEDDNQGLYHKKIIDTILEMNCANDFIVALSYLIKQLAVDHLHIVGDIYDRGPYADKIVDLLMQHHSMDLQWGNHDILWMGASFGSQACIAAVIRNNLKSLNMDILERSYGISLRALTLFGIQKYPYLEPIKAALKAITILLFKLEGQLIKRHPEYDMDEQCLLEQVDFSKGTVAIEGVCYPLNDTDFPTVSPTTPYALTKEEEEIMSDLTDSFLKSRQLRRHINFFFDHGSIYKIFNGNLLFHGCIPMDEDGNFSCVTMEGRTYYAKSYLDYAERVARRVYHGSERQSDLDFLYFLWCGEKSPLFGRKIKTFARTFLDDEATWEEKANPYYRFHDQVRICNMILREFGLYAENSHIINGHTPVHTSEGEGPIHAGGKLLVIDGGFCKEYHKTTGIAGYTLIYNSHGLRIKEHHPFESIDKALSENKDIESESRMIELCKQRVMVKDTEVGREIADEIQNLMELYENKSKKMMDFL